MTARLLTTLVLLLASGAAAAHGSILDRQICKRGETVFSENFAFTPEELNGYAACLNDPTGADCTTPVPVSVICSIETCGEFDDDFGVAKRMAINYCVAVADQPVALGESGVTVTVTSSANFNGPDHHDKYRFREGLGGICWYCKPSVTRQTDR